MMNLEKNQSVRFNGRSCVVVSIDPEKGLALLITKANDTEFVVDIVTGKEVRNERKFQI